MASQPSPEQPEQTRTDAAEPRRFEGNTVEEVLAEVRATFGADAEIVEANKVRRGGLGGFFAKESVEVTARPRRRGRRRAGAAGAAGASAAGTESAAANPAGSAGAGAASLLDLAAAVSAQEGPVPAAADPTAAAGPTAPVAEPTAAPADPTATTGPLPQAQPAPGPWSPPHVAGFEPMRHDEMPRLSTEGGAFTEVLQRIATDAGPEIAEAVDRRLGLRAAEDLAVTDLPGADLPAADLPAAGLPTAGEPAAKGLTPVGPQARAATTPTPAMGLPVVPAASQPDLTPDAPAAPTTASVDAMLPEALDDHDPDRTARLLSWLERDNLPRTTLTTALRGLPTLPALPDIAGVVVAVVGPRQVAMRLARQLAAAHDADDRNVILASTTYRGRQLTDGQLVTDAAEADRERQSWRRREAPTFVVVEDTGSLQPGALAWTREIVTALEAHRVIGVVPASRKTTDVAGWARGIGGLDAIALHEVDLTATPYDVLALEVPVGWLDDTPATPDAWADLLLGAAA